MSLQACLKKCALLEHDEADQLAVQSACDWLRAVLCAQRTGSRRPPERRVEMFTPLMSIDLAGNLFMLGACYIGYNDLSDAEADDKKQA